MVKRTIDIVVSVCLLLLLTPLFLLISLLIKLDSEGSVFYKSVRIGRGGLPFRILKFRSMVKDAELKGPDTTKKNDPRVTSLGRILRATKLDELPNLFNVLRGELSIVGPRPEIPEYVERYTPEEREVLRVNPGMTGLSQIKYINESSQLRDIERDYPSILADKLKLDLDYVKENSILLDIKILISTIKAILFQAMC